MKRLVLLSLMGLVVFANTLEASRPVKVTITGCVVEGALMSERTDFGTHVSEGKYRITALTRTGATLDLKEYEGKMISLSGNLLPGDRFYVDQEPISVIGPCWFF